MVERRFSAKQDQVRFLDRFRRTWFLFAVALPSAAAIFGLFLAAGDAQVAFQPEVGVSVALLVAVWIERGVRAVLATALFIGVVGFLVPLLVWKVSITTSLIAVVVHVLMVVVAAGLYVNLSTRFSSIVVGPMLALFIALAAAAVLPALIISAAPLSDVQLNISSTQLAFLWAASAILGGMLIAPLGLIWLPPFAGLASVTKHRSEALVTTAAVAAVAIVVAITTIDWFLWALVPPLLWTAVRCGPRWVVTQIAMTGLVFVFFAERYGRNTVWENVLAAQVALLTIVLSIPVVALAILWMQQALGRAEEALELAHRDSLTGVFSRRALDELVDEAMRSASEKNAFVGIVYLDIDEFKLLNDSLGHAAGDAVLAELGQRLRQCLRSSDHAVRVGGDEFVVVVRDLKTSEDLEPIAASLRATFGKDFLVGGKLTPVKVSMGLCTSSGGEQPAALIARADEAMYRAKNR